MHRCDIRSTGEEIHGFEIRLKDVVTTVLEDWNGKRDHRDDPRRRHGPTVSGH